MKYLKIYRPCLGRFDGKKYIYRYNCYFSGVKQVISFHLRHWTFNNDISLSFKIRSLFKFDFWGLLSWANHGQYIFNSFCSTGIHLDKRNFFILLSRQYLYVAMEMNHNKPIIIRKHVYSPRPGINPCYYTRIINGQETIDLIMKIIIHLYHAVAICVWCPARKYHYSADLQNNKGARLVRLQPRFERQDGCTMIEVL